MQITIKTNIVSESFVLNEEEKESLTQVAKILDTFTSSMIDNNLTHLTINGSFYNKDFLEMVYELVHALLCSKSIKMER